MQTPYSRSATTCPLAITFYPEAHAQSLITIEETSEAGTVGELKVTNRGTQAVLLLEVRSFWV